MKTKKFKKLLITLCAMLLVIAMVGLNASAETTADTTADTTPEAVSAVAASNTAEGASLEKPPIIPNSLDDEFEVSGLKYKVTSESGGINTVEVIKNNYTLTSYTIPDTVTYSTITYTVTGIGNNAFFGCTALDSITLPNSVTTIGNDAFSGCNSLKSITLPDSVTTIGNNAFRGCSALESIILPDFVTTIGDSAFEVCFSLKSITLGDSVTTIGNNAFNGCKKLKSITLPDSVTTIGNNAFFDCISLESITLGDSVTTIGNDAFWNCTSLKSITLPDSVTTIGNNAFFGCSALESITLGDSVTIIETGAFEGCFSLESITLPDSVTTIGDSAFSGCSVLESITLPDSVTTIGESAFYNCHKLNEVVFYGSTPPDFGRVIFANITTDINVFVPAGTTNAYVNKLKSQSNFTKLVIKEYTFVEITQTSLPNGVMNVPYKIDIKTNLVGAEFKILSGNLPDGLSLSTTGQISGTPTVEGSFNFEIEAKSSQNIPTKTTKNFTIIISKTQSQAYTMVQIPSDKNGYTAKVDVDFADFKSVEIDNKSLKSTDFKAWSGSTFLKLEKAYLDTLIAGNHTITLIFKDGTATETFIKTKTGTGTGTGSSSGFGSDTSVYEAKPWISGLESGKSNTKNDPDSNPSTGIKDVISVEAMFIMFSLVSAVLVLRKKKID